ncbi:Homeobox protein [Dimargaris verticillata]|uniref:Homeobox protein n=1 Tax=Dimargaris verticillata TaxID=2761393 RepID=A0A9W8BDB9_9FUNG|nr:Homeobox protein [Dimargaris verticillata]
MALPMLPTHYQPYGEPASCAQRVFRPVVIFNSSLQANSSPGLLNAPGTDSMRAAESPSPLLESLKVRIDDMLMANAQYWQSLVPFNTTTSPVGGPDMRFGYPGAVPGCAPMPAPNAPYGPYGYEAPRYPSGYPVAGIPPTSSYMPYASPSTMGSPSRSDRYHPCAVTAAGKTGKKRRGNLPKAVTAILKAWLLEHVKHPYPTEEEKLALANQTDLTLAQINNWFINARRRILQPILDQYAKSAVTSNGSASSGNHTPTSRSPPLGRGSSQGMGSSPESLPASYGAGSLADATGVCTNPLGLQTVSLPKFKQKLYEQINNTGSGARATHRERYKSMAKV